MRTDTKIYHKMPHEMEKLFAGQGYCELTVENQGLFDTYYDIMNDHWSANTCFLNMYSWKESYPTYFKVTKELIIVITYLNTEGYPVAVPFVGHYTNENVSECLAVLKEDFAVFNSPLVIMDVVPWMLPYYEASGTAFDIEDNRDYMDYTFTPEQFLAGREAQDDRYRYNYFKRKFAYETEEITPAHRDEIRQFMEDEWCADKSCEECHCGCLKKVVDNLIPVFDKIRIDGIIVRVDGKIAGICIVSCRNGLGVYQYKNAVNRMKGINEYLLRESFDRFFQSVRTINYTEDMGVENLRYYKEHMAPAYTLLSKLTLTERVGT